MIGQEDRLCNDLRCVKRDVKPAVTTTIICVSVCVAMVSGAVCVTVYMLICHQLIINRFEPDCPSLL